MLFVDHNSTLITFAISSIFVFKIKPTVCCDCCHWPDLAARIVVVFDVVAAADAASANLGGGGALTAMTYIHKS